MKNQNKGITLIALVITIIVLLILAGVSISLVLGDNGILKRSVNAREEYTKASLQEELALAWADYCMARYTEPNLTFEDCIRKNVNPDEIESITTVGNVVIIEGKGDTFRIDTENGAIAKDSAYSTWDGTSASDGLVGEGTKEKPYLIQSANDLYYFSQAVSAGDTGTITGLNADRTPNNVDKTAKFANYKLTTNIALNDVSNYSSWTSEEFDRSTLNKWNPIGKQDSTFYNYFGKFDGAGHEITGMYIEEDATNLGLFASLYTNKAYASEGAVVQNLRVTNAYIKGRDRLGGIAGDASKNVTALDKSQILNCQFSGYIEATTGSAAGIVAYCDDSDVKNCSVNATIKGINEVGGIVGTIVSANSVSTEISNCTMNGEVISTYRGAGIVGNAGKVTVKNCTNKAKIANNNVSSTNSFGGIVGVGASTILQDCKNQGNIELNEGATYVGGIAGALGYTENSEMVRCTNTGNISLNPNYVGGLVGDLNLGTTLNLNFKQCSTTGTITTDKTNKGDLVGFTHGTISTNE